MILYDFRCANGHGFEAVVDEQTATDPLCPTCGAAGARLISTPTVGGSCSAGLGEGELPQTWTAADRGDRETVDRWRAQALRRERLTERFPEIAGDRRPVVAHEGVFEQRPLRAGEDVDHALREAKEISLDHADRQAFERRNG
ncbi:zinc ribbon domain-containing protein [Pseudoclavibacter sp. CFCC 13611]|uniref:zinc ribbon domain-containing protein n=1 Tax=Pseudoclavibacter sp. CFCC 13611 TaxID=2615178 RepID=UPI001300D0EE|nr:zinc ribbon domain-containing protein [Pseudoclavibacter sp. CFCC 13611]KAB1663738.1 DUF1178 family protein [Pseudoclavibacter sp. CFCC 13611]KAB1664513.1 DUF1178 family protein [Pseudoclavibacter sp. CFCC 13611]